MVLDEEFNGIPAAMKVMQHWFAADAIDHMVQEEPLFLVEDVESAISSLNRYPIHQNIAIKCTSTHGLKACEMTYNIPTALTPCFGLYC